MTNHPNNLNTIRYNLEKELLLYEKFKCQKEYLDSLNYLFDKQNKTKNIIIKCQMKKVYLILNKVNDH